MSYPSLSIEEIEDYRDQHGQSIPDTGKQIAKSTGTNRRKETERVAAKWEHDLQNGRYKAASKVSWVEFLAKYEDEVLAGLAEKTERKVSSTFNAVERILRLQKLAALTADRLSFMQSRLRDEGLAETTIKGHLAHLNASLNWAHRVGLLNEIWLRLRRVK